MELSYHYAYSSVRLCFVYIGYSLFRAPLAATKAAATPPGVYTRTKTSHLKQDMSHETYNVQKNTSIKHFQTDKSQVKTKLKNTYISSLYDS